MTITVHSLNQAGQHATNFVQRGVERLVLLFCEQAKIARQQKKILEFTGRPRRNIEKLTKLYLAATSTTLRDVCRDRSRRSPHLAGNAVPLGIRERARRHVDAQDQLVALLPNLELLKILHSSSEIPFSGVHLQLISNNFQIAPSHRDSQTVDLCVYLQLITNNCQLPTGTPC